MAVSAEIYVPGGCPRQPLLEQKKQLRWITVSSLNAPICLSSRLGRPTGRKALAVLSVPVKTASYPWRLQTKTTKSFSFQWRLSSSLRHSSPNLQKENKSGALLFFPPPRTSNFFVAPSMLVRRVWKVNKTFISFIFSSKKPQPKRWPSHTQ